MVLFSLVFSIYLKLLKTDDQIGRESKVNECESINTASCIGVGVGIVAGWVWV